MERKRRSGSVPQLGRISLKRVAVPATSAVPVERTPEPDTLPELAARVESTSPQNPGSIDDLLREAVLESGFMQELSSSDLEPLSTPPSAAPAAATPTSVPASDVPAVLRRALVVEVDRPVREAVCACLPEEVFETEAFETAHAALDAFNERGAALVVVGRELRGGSGGVLSKLIRRAKKGSAVGIVLMSPVYRDPILGAREASAYGADAFLPLPASAELLAERVELALSMREPIERLEVMPVEVARAIDARFAVFDKQDYYALLEVHRRADAREIQAKYHEIARWLHPDRHARLRRTHPHVYERINTLYKRVGEAYTVLVDDDRRRSYNLGLHKRGSLRLETGRSSNREQRELALCETDEARSHVLESLEARSLGDLEWAEQAMGRAVHLEPENRELVLILDSIRKLLDIVQRGRA